MLYLHFLKNFPSKIFLLLMSITKRDNSSPPNNLMRFLILPTTKFNIKYFLDVTSVVQREFKEQCV